MRFVSDPLAASLALTLLAVPAPPLPPALAEVHRQHYSMGTMFDIVVYHASRAEAERAVEKAFAEVSRLDNVLSHYKPGSELSKLNREGNHGPVHVDASLFDIVSQATMVWRRSAGTFDVTIAPLLRTWKVAAERGRRPSAAEIAAARRCVGSEKIEFTPPNEIRFRSDCLELDLGGIGKGYAVDRAIAVLRSAGIPHAIVNSGGSSIAGIGAPPGRSGWPVLLGAGVSGSSMLLLQGNSISTSRQDPAGDFGHIIDPRNGEPAHGSMSVSVVAPSATLSDALSTTLLMLSGEPAEKLLARFSGVSALWISSGGELHASYRQSDLVLADAR